MLTTHEAAAILGVDASRVRRLILDGKLKAVRFGRDWMIDEREIDAYRATTPRMGRKRNYTKQEPR